MTALLLFMGQLKQKVFQQPMVVTGFTKEPEISPNEKKNESQRNNIKKDFSLYDSKERAAPVEHDAVLYKDTPEAFEFIDTLVGFVRKSSFTCDTVSSFSPMVMSNGFTLSCNGFSYKYNIKNNGGNVAVTVDN
ncbi:hypothetical protein ZS24_001576 [Salmonella enterica subsp. enterica]|nr:hypothetical protein [Salmonella enterica subsp. enterica]